MFLCKSCHNETGCPHDHWEIGLLSYGLCESCGGHTLCTDCHYEPPTNKTTCMICGKEFKKVDPADKALSRAQQCWLHIPKLPHKIHK
jgi:hypothetical protein